MSEFVYKAPKPTLRNRIQFVEIEIAEGRYAGQKIGSCGDALAGVDGLIQKVARDATGYMKADVKVSFDTGWSYYTRLDIERGMTVEDLIDAIDSDARWYTGTKPAHMTQKDYNLWVGYMNVDKIDEFCKLMSTPQFNR